MVDKEDTSSILRATRPRRQQVLRPRPTGSFVRLSGGC